MASPRADTLLQLVFRGECLAGHDPQVVRDAVAQALKLESKGASRLFSGKRMVIRRDVDAAAAARAIARFARLGAVLRAEPSRPRRVLQADSRPAGPAGTLGSRWRGPREWLNNDLLYVVLGVVFGVGLVFGPLRSALWSGAPPPAAATALAVLPMAPPETAAAAALPILPETDDELPPDMTAEALRDYRLHYRAAAGHKAFAISFGGAHAWQAGAASENEAREAALAACMRAAGADSNGCRVIDGDGHWLE